MQAAVFQLDPLAALADAWSLRAQMERFFATGAGKDLFGDSQRTAIQDSLTLSEEAAALARSVVGVDGVKDVRPKLEAWLDENPIHDLSFGRRSVGADASAITAAEWGSGGLRSVGQVEDLLRDLSDRLTIYGEQIPELARWHSELLAMEVDQNTLAPLWEDIGSIERSAASLDAEIKELRRFVETTPHLVETERALILEVFEREIDSALADVNRQRVATIAALSSERKFILAELDSLAPSSRTT